MRRILSLGSLVLAATSLAASAAIAARPAVQQNSSMTTQSGQTATGGSATATGGKGGDANSATSGGHAVKGADGTSSYQSGANASSIHIIVSSSSKSVHTKRGAARRARTLLAQVRKLARALTAAEVGTPPATTACVILKSVRGAVKAQINALIARFPRVTQLGKARSSAMKIIHRKLTAFGCA